MLWGLLKGIIGQVKVLSLCYGSPNMNERILVDPRIQHGKPVIGGTRVPVARIVGGLAGGMILEEIQKEYGIAAEGVRAALEFAA